MYAIITLLPINGRELMVSLGDIAFLRKYPDCVDPRATPPVWQEKAHLVFLNGHTEDLQGADAENVYDLMLSLNSTIHLFSTPNAPSHVLFNAEAVTSAAFATIEDEQGDTVPLFAAYFRGCPYALHVRGKQASTARHFMAARALRRV